MSSLTFSDSTFLGFWCQWASVCHNTEWLFTGAIIWFVAPVANILFYDCNITSIKIRRCTLCFKGLRFTSNCQSWIGQMESLIKSVCTCQPCVVSTGTVLSHPQLIINQPIVDQQLWVQPLCLPEERRLITSAWALISLVLGHIWFLFICLWKQARWVLTCFDRTIENFPPFWICKENVCCVSASEPALVGVNQKSSFTIGGICDSCTQSFAQFMQFRLFWFISRVWQLI